MKHHAKAASAGSTQAIGSSRGLLRRAVVTRGASSDSKGSGAPSSRRAQSLLALLALAIAAFAINAAAAAAAPPSVKTDAISNVSYTSAHVTGFVTSDGSGFGFGDATTWGVQYSTDQLTWSLGYSTNFGTALHGAFKDKPVGADITVPKGGTKYFVRLVANNGFFLGAEPEVPSPKPYPSFTTLVADPPVVEATDNATEVEYTTASVSGKVNRPLKSNELTCNFEVITDAQYTANQGKSAPAFEGAALVPCEPNPVEAEGSSEVKAKLTGLTNATTYHLRLAVSNASAADAKEAASTFTTLAVDPPTVVSVDDAGNVFSRSASAAGVIKRSANPDPAFDIVACRFEYVTAAQFGATGFAGAGTAPCVEPINNGPDEETSVTAPLTGLEPETTYHLRLAAENAAATPGTKVAANTFTTTAKVAKPTVLSIQNATGVDQDSAKVTGEVQPPPGGEDPALLTTCRVEYLTEAGFQGNEEQSLAVHATFGTYTVRFRGQTTPPLAFDASPTAVQAALEALSTIGAGNVLVRGGPGNLNGAAPYLIVFSGALAGQDVEALTTNGENLRTNYVRETGAFVLTTAEGGHSPGFVNPFRTDCDPLQPEGPQKVAINILGLFPNTTYHLRLTAENGGGTDSKDATATFTTGPNLPPSAVIGPITDITGWGATLSAETDLDKYPYTTYAFWEVSTDGVLWETVAETNGGNSAKLTPIQPVVITGLRGATKYFVRLRVGAPGDPLNVVSQQPHPSFTTVPVSPATVLKTNDATDVTAETAKVSGEIERPADPDPGFDANCHFEYVTDAQFQANGYEKALQTPCGIEPLTTPGEKKAVEAELTDLKSGTKYHLRLTATNAGPDASLEAANTFTTIAVPTTVATTAGASDNEGGYYLGGVVNPRNSTISDCKFVYGPTSDADFKKYPFAVPCSPIPGPVKTPVTVEGHVTGLTPDAEYHFRLVVTNVFDTQVTPDRTFVPTITAKEPCPANEQLRVENSSLALPECRAYEMVSPPGKEGFNATLRTFDGGDRVAYLSGAGNIAKSGQNAIPPNNLYVAARTAAGWETIPNLNGSSGSFRAHADLEGETSTFRLYSADLLSSIWRLARKSCSPCSDRSYLRGPDGAFTLIGSMTNVFGHGANLRASADLSHVVNVDVPTQWGNGIYEYVGTGMDQPRRVDVDNFGAPISGCIGMITFTPVGNAVNRSISTDGSTIVNHVYGALKAETGSTAPGSCQVGDPPADELWARVNGTTSIDVSASHCDRVAPACNAPSNAKFAATTPDGSRVFFTTTQQLLNADTDETNDIYACDIPSGNPAPNGEKANHCAAFRQVSGARTDADVESVNVTSENGNTVLFTAKGVLSDNKDAFGEKAVAGDHNLYVWRDDTSPSGQTAFVGRLDTSKDPFGMSAQSTPDGRYLVFTTANQLLDTDTDTARDVYRYDAGTGELTRASTNVFGVAGNGDFDAGAAPPSDDGQKIVFTTAEPLNLAVDGNEEPDVYLWTPARVSLISTGSSGAAPRSGIGQVLHPAVAIDASGRDIYFETAQPLTPADGDDLVDIYDARIGGGFSFAEVTPCSGERCQPDPTPAPPKNAPLSSQPGLGNPTPPKPCPKGKVRKKNGKCGKKPRKKRSGKNSHGKKASHKQGGGK